MQEIHSIGLAHFFGRKDLLWRIFFVYSWLRWQKKDWLMKGVNCRLNCSSTNWSSKKPWVWVPVSFYNVFIVYSAEVAICTIVQISGSLSTFSRLGLCWLQMYFLPFNQRFMHHQLNMLYFLAKCCTRYIRTSSNPLRKGVVEGFSCRVVLSMTN